ncbi:hypothetical protein RQM59_06060 [Flavobacteriaceae bacterium S356]|uniref:Glucosamine inositolphosphorylceramide transferase 1 N-terminal domain-containing protein n=1 Tax=Asprobacillus argus TaxID=3076534 RepID=A0ABU3LDZ5_9FLAO|nr:hypothetical protein [Flavobacteriaceae bacterium S356]
MQILPSFFGFTSKVRGWSIATFRINKGISEITMLDVPKQRQWFQVKNKECGGVADPFLIKHNNRYYMFFEYEYKKPLYKDADIAYATSKDGINWTYKEKILEESFHQSFPYVFKMKGDFYMLPESYQSNQVRLYKAIDFPKKWILDTVLFEGKKLVDTIFLIKDSVYYWFTTNLNTSELLLFYSDSFKGTWVQHPCSPISKDISNNRNAGAIIEEENHYYRLAQDATEGYGSGVNLFGIEKISKQEYQEKLIKKPFLYKNKGMIKDALHHVSFLEEDEHIVAIDGANFAIRGIEIK